MRAKTIQRLAILIAVIVVGTILVYIGKQYQVARMDQTVLAQAEEAEKGGDLSKAEGLYQEHLELFPDDWDNKLKYADLLLKGAKTPARVSAANGIFSSMLDRFPNRDDVRRRLAESLVDTNATEAETHLTILLSSTPDDARLEYLMGRCHEQLGRADKAVASYRSAIGHKAEDRFDAYRRIATLLRGKLNDAKAADQAVEAMVKEAPQDARSYLERGRYRAAFKIPGSEADYDQAMKLAPDKPEIYLERARQVQLAEGGDARTKSEKARELLEAGLKAAPNNAALHEELANVYIRGNRVDDAIAHLREALKKDELKDALGLRFTLANLLTERGQPADLLVQIEELGKRGFNPVLMDYLTACHDVNSGEWSKAKSRLTKIQGSFDTWPAFKARVNNLLAQCYAQLGDADRREEAYTKALRAQPQDVTAQLGLASTKVAQGEIDEAIQIYRRLKPGIPQVRSPLARLLVARNQQQPEIKRDWREVNELLAEILRASPESTEAVVLQSEILMSQGKATEAAALLEKAQARHPKAVDVWVARVDVERRQRRLDQARALLERAEKLLGDSVELRLERSRLIVAGASPSTADELLALAGNAGGFPRPEHRRLLETLAVELSQRGEFSKAAGLWKEIATLEPTSLDPRLRWFDASLQANDEGGMKKALEEVRRIDGEEGLWTKFYGVRILIWQARNGDDKVAQQRLRSDARARLSELSSSRPDWAVIPVALAEIEEQELAEMKADDDARKAKQGEIANLYVQAINLGQQNLAVVRRAMELLVASGRSAEVSQLWSRFPASSAASATLQKLAVGLALRSQDYGRAVDLARKAAAAEPASLQAGLALVQSLFADGKRDEAESELRKLVDREPADATRWLLLVQYLIQTKQLDKAEKAITRAKTAIPKDKQTLALAACWAELGRGYQVIDESKKATCFEQAKTLYRAAQAEKPDDPAILRQLVEFLLATDQLADAQVLLSGVVDHDAKELGSSEKSQWARRALALTLISGNDFRKIRKALTVIEPIVRAEPKPGADGKSTMKPEDARVIARVYQAQQDASYRRQAIDLLSQLVSRNQANPDDRLFLAQLYRVSGDWPKAREQYQRLLEQTKQGQAIGVQARRPMYMTQYLAELLRDHPGGNREQELAEAKGLLEELRLAQPDSLGVVAFEARLLKALNQVDKAVELIQSTANRPNMTPPLIKALASLSEDLGQAPLAEQLFRKLTSMSSAPMLDRLALLLFLGRQGRIDDALDIAEPMWKTPGATTVLCSACLELLYADNRKPKPEQVNRVATWLEKALQDDPKSPVLMIGLGNIRERQQRYADAEALYRRVLDQGTSDVIALNNLAWLTVLKDHQPAAALEMINSAINLRGPLPEFLDTRAVIYLDAGDSRRAIDDLENGIALDPTPSKYFHLARAYLEANNKEAAKQSLAKGRIKGLDRDSLHPLEFNMYEKLVDALDAR